MASNRRVDAQTISSITTTWHPANASGKRQQLVGFELESLSIIAIGIFDSYGDYLLKWATVPGILY